MQKKKFNLLLLVLIAMSSCICAQNNKSLSIEYFEECIVRAPFKERKDSPTYSGGVLSYELTKPRNGMYEFSHVFQLGYFHHRHVNQLGFVAWKPEFEVRIARLFGLHLIPGLAYAHSFTTQQQYRLEDGIYIKKMSTGRPHFMPSLGFGLSLNFNRFNCPFEVYFRQEYAVIYPNTRRLPISLHSLRGLGIKYFFNTTQLENE